MTRPIFVWRLDELTSVCTIRTSSTGAELKREDAHHRLWLHDGIVKEQELQDDGSWLTIHRYPAKTS